LNVKNDTVIATAQMTKPVAEGHVYEGWFEDKGDASGYSLSVGKFDGNGTPAIKQWLTHTRILCFLSLRSQKKTQILTHLV
jgi:hypothetical protein